MPFLGRDWRSPGDEWVRTAEGWEKLRLWRVKLFENLNENIVARLMKLALTDWYMKKDMFRNNHQPHLLYIRGNSKERMVPTGLSETFIKLDLHGAVRDIRRFNYVCKLMQCLLIDKLASLSGTAQKHIFSILEEMVNQAIKTGYNVNVTKTLLEKTEKALEHGQYQHIGSSHLWVKHKQNVSNLLNKINLFQIKKRDEDGGIMLMDLPEECIRDIMLRLADHSDIMHTGMTNTAIHEVSEEGALWQQLSLYHFSHIQMLTFLPRETRDDNVNWKQLYRRCMRRYGKRDAYADMLALCTSCDSLFWQSLGHPCICGDNPRSTTLTPEAFIRLFLL